MAGALGAWTSLEDHQPGAGTTCQAPYLLEEVTTIVVDIVYWINIFFIYTCWHDGHMGDRGLRCVRYFGWW
jgi:hypothetical protein